MNINHLPIYGQPTNLFSSSPFPLSGIEIPSKSPPPPDRQISLMSYNQPSSTFPYLSPILDSPFFSFSKICSFPLTFRFPSYPFPSIQISDPSFPKPAYSLTTAQHLHPIRPLAQPPQPTNHNFVSFPFLSFSSSLQSCAPSPPPQIPKMKSKSQKPKITRPPQDDARRANRTPPPPDPPPSSPSGTLCSFPFRFAFFFSFCSFALFFIIYFSLCTMQ